MPHTVASSTVARTVGKVLLKEALKRGARRIDRDGVQERIGASIGDSPIDPDTFSVTAPGGGGGARFTLGDLP